MMIRHNWYVFESRSFKQAEMPQIIHRAYTYNLFDANHLICAQVMVILPYRGAGLGWTMFHRCHESQAMSVGEANVPYHDPNGITQRRYQTNIAMNH